jgi:hypothetical protein
LIHAIESRNLDCSLEEISVQELEIAASKQQKFSKEAVQATFGEHDSQLLER